MSPKFTRIDKLLLQDHHHLEVEDVCFFLGEYTARKGFNFSPTNNLIYNLKKSPLRRGAPEWQYKEQAIVEAGKNLREVLTTPRNLPILKAATLVPIPPSKCKGHAEYDDRILLVLREVSSGITLDIRELVTQKSSRNALHGSSDPRPTPAELLVNLQLDSSCRNPAPKTVYLFDDILTTGCHFKAVQMLLHKEFPGLPVVGIFLARRLPNTTEV